MAEETAAFSEGESEDRSQVGRNVSDPPKSKKGMSGSNEKQRPADAKSKPGKTLKSVPCDFEGNMITVREKAEESIRESEVKEENEDERDGGKVRTKDPKKTLPGQKSDESESRETDRGDPNREQKSRKKDDSETRPKQSRPRENPTVVLSVNPDNADEEQDQEASHGRANRSKEQRVDRETKQDRSHGGKTPLTTRKQGSDSEHRDTPNPFRGQSKRDSDKIKTSRDRHDPEQNRDKDAEDSEDEFPRAPERLGHRGESDQSKRSTDMLADSREHLRQSTKSRQDRR